MLTLLGLGNPDEMYAATRHNCGWIFLDYVAEELRLRFAPGKGSYFACNNEVFQLIKPLTYMNNSGVAARQLTDAGARVEELVVIYDDVDLELGTVRFRLSGSSGTHRGMDSVVYHLDTEDVPRLRFGIGPAEGDLVDFVLSPFEEGELETLKSLFPKALEGLTALAEGARERAVELMNRKE